MGDVAVDVGNSTIMKLSASSGSVLWSASVSNDGALAVDPVDLGVYTGLGSHFSGFAGTVYKYDASGNLWWSKPINRSGSCNFYYVSDVAVDATSSNPGVVWTERACYGGVAKTDRTSGTQQWSIFTNDIGRASIDPINGQIYTTTTAGPVYNYNTMYSVSATGSVSSASSCEGLTEINPSDGQFYRGGNMNSNGCGLFLSQVNKTTLTPNWTMNLTPFISSFDSLAVQPVSGGFIYVGSVNSNKVVVINPTTQSVVTIFTPAVAPASMAVNPQNGNIYLTNGVANFVFAYTPVGGFVWVSPDLGGPVNSVAAARTVFSPPPTPTVNDLAANVNNTRIFKLNGSNGKVLWTNVVTNDGALAVDQVDFGVYTGLGGHNAGPTNVYKYSSSGSLAWSNTLGPTGGCAFYYVGHSAVDTSSANPGVLWSTAGCNGYIAKSDRNTGTQLWSQTTEDVWRTTIDPVDGDIFTTTNASPFLGYNTFYKATRTGGLTSGSSCEGYTDLNPADGMLYRGGNMASNGCGRTLSQINKTTLLPDWTMDLSPYIASFDSLAVQPWSGGWIYVGSTSSNAILVINPTTQTVVRTINTAIAPTLMAVDPNGGNVFIANSANNVIYAYSTFGTQVWNSGDLGGPITNLAAPRDIVGLLPTAARVSVGGRVTTADGDPVSGALVTLTDRNGTMRSCRVSSFGYFRINEVGTGETYVLNVSSKSHTFPARVITVNDQIVDLIITAGSPRSYVRLPK